MKTQVTILKRIFKKFWLLNVMLSLIIAHPINVYAQNINSPSFSTQGNALPASGEFTPRINDYGLSLPIPANIKGAFYFGPRGIHSTGIPGNLYYNTAKNGMDIFYVDQNKNRASFKVLAAAPGTLSFRALCNTGKKDGNGKLVYLAMIYIRHGDITNDKVKNGLATGYVHVRVDPTKYGMDTRKFGQVKYYKYPAIKDLNVERGFEIGTSVDPSKYPAQGCGSGSGDHLHFSLMGWKYSSGYTYTDLDISNAYIGGWQVIRGSLKEISSGKLRTPGSSIWNKGLVGNGKTPGKITTLSPVNLEKIISPQNPATITFKWTKLTGTWSNPVEYHIQASESADFSTLLLDTKAIAENVTELNGLLDCSTCFWRMRSSNLNGAGDWSPTILFSITGLLPNPTLLSPAHNGIANPDFTFTWNGVPDAAEYFIEYSGPVSGNSGWIADTSLAVTSLPAGDYTWRIKARNDSGESGWSEIWNFTVQPIVSVPVAPTLSSPTNNGTTNPDITFTWDGVSGATEYFIEYMGASSGNSGWISNTTFPVTPLPAGSYTWHAKARNSGGEGEWSQTWSFTIQPNIVIPKTPTLSSPTDSGITGPDFVFSWNGIPDAIEYFMEYAGTSSGNSGWIADTIFPVTSLPNGNYTWRAKARNTNGESEWSQTWNLTVQTVVINVPNAPTLISPSDGAILGNFLNLIWDNVPDATEYYVMYAGPASGNSGWMTNTIFPTASLPAGAYTWKVKARNAGGESEWSQSWRFTVTVPPDSPTLTSPADGAIIVGTNIPFTWNSVTDATAYYLEYSGTTSGNSSWITTTTSQVTALPDGTYTWRVKARNAAGESAWSQARSVSFQAPPAQISINSPTAINPTGACSSSNWMTFTNNLGHTYYVTQNNNVNPWSANPNYAYWKTTVPVAGRYKIEAYIPSHGTLSWCGSGGKSISANTTDAHYQVYTSGNTWTKVEKSQNIGGNVWLNLGEFYLTTGNYYVVKLIDSNHQTSYSQLIFFSDIRITWVGQ